MPTKGQKNDWRKRHFVDVRRATARRADGKPYQVPVICTLDIITVTRGGDSWTNRPDLVSCPDCLERIRF